MSLIRFFPASLKLRLTCVVVALVLGATILATTAALMFAERGMKETLGSQQYDQITSAARMMDERLIARQTLLRTLSEDLPVSVREDPGLLQSYLQQRLILQEQFSNVAAFDPQGRLIATIRQSGGLANESVRERPYFKKTLQQGRGVISEPFRSARTGNPVVLLTQPILDSRGRLAFIVAGALDLGAAKLFDEINMVRLGESGFIYIMTTAGILVSHPTRTRLLEHINARPGRNVATESALGGFEGWTEARNKDGSNGIYAYKRMRSTNWIVGSRFPSNEAFAPIRHVRDQVLAAAAILAVLAGVLGWAAIRRLLAPLEQLRRQTTLVRTGVEASRVLQGRGADEIGELSGAIYDLVAQRERANDSYSASEKRAHMIADAMPALIAYVDLDERYVFTNAYYRTFGMDPQALIGATIEEVVGHKDYAVIREQIARVRLGESVTFEPASTGVDRRHFIAHLIPDTDPAGQVLGFYTFVMDITERKTAELRQAESERRAAAASLAKSEFVANMSHEIRTPLNGVLGIAQLLAGTALSAEQRHFVSLIQTAGLSLLGILNDVLDFSKIEAGRMDLSPALFAITDVLDPIAAGMAVGRGDKPVSLLIRVDPSLPRHWVGDAMRIQQVLSNLVGNAIKFTERGQVALDVACTDAADGRRLLVFAVRDTGIGIAADEREHLFSAFSQADASTSRRYGGSGLGLAICRRIADLMGGEIALDSEPGRGSTFTFSIPLQTGDAPPALAPDRRRLLVVGSQAGIAPYVSYLLRALGYEVDQADSPDEAAARRGGASPDAVILAEPDAQPGALARQAALLHAPALILMMSTEQRRLAADAVDAIAHAAVILTPPTAGNLRAVLGHHHAGGADAAPQGRELAGQRILVVEDNELNQFVARSLLDKHGARVTTVSDGRAAIALLRSDPHVDVILMDIQMPGLDGFATTGIIRHELGLRTRILAMSAGVTMDEQDRCAAVGMDGFIAKPIDLQQLLAALAPRAAPVGKLPAPPPTVFDADALLALSAPDSQQRVAMLDTIARVVDEAPHKFAAVCAALAANERKQAAALLHGMRGAVGALGARRFIAATASLEAAVHQEEQAVAAELVDRVGQELDATLAAAAPWLAAERARTAGAPRVEQAADAATLARFALLLERQNMQALPAFDALRSHFGAVLTQGDYARLDTAIATLDFAEALTILRAQQPDRHVQP